MKVKLPKWHESGCTGLHIILQYVEICVGHGHSLSDLYVARCREGEVRIQSDLKLVNVDQGFYNVMVYPSLFLYFFYWLFLPCSYLIGAPSLHLYWFCWRPFLLPLFLSYL